MDFDFYLPRVLHDRGKTGTISKVPCLRQDRSFHRAPADLHILPTLAIKS